ncbi:GDSL-type esterase/lipase family protein [Roseibium sp. HPY-6]|uniref:GDSL-type esterase/lipase family protein n=1 Tax=Roseibium sp. HPY-6 TaxID=3229852 RepID=UPI0033907304
MRDLRICFVGDSYINGTGDERCLGWIGRLCERRFAWDYRLSFYDLGIRGETTPEIRLRWKQESDVRFQEGADNRVVLQFGMNDIAEVTDKGRQVEEDVSISEAEALVSEVSALYPTLWVGLPPANEACSPMQPSEGLEVSFTQRRGQELNERFKAVAEALSIPYLDLQTPLLANRDYMSSLTRGDKMHCDGTGYAMIANLVDNWSAWDAWFKD